MDWQAIIAGYAAVVATIIGARQLLTDLPHVNVSVSERSQIWGGPPGTPPDEVTSVTVTNAGRRPAIITPVAFMPPKRGWIATPHQILQQVPFTLGEGENKTLVLHKKFFDSKNPGPPSGSVWIVGDSLGHNWPRKARVRVGLRRWGNWWRRTLMHEDAWEASERVHGTGQDNS
jgi:hypothetical protein